MFKSTPMENLVAKFRHFKNNKFINFGIPFILFIVGSSFALKEFTSLRYEFRQSTVLDPAELKKEGLERKDPKEITLEKLYERDQKEVDLDNWTNIRGPRPWEDTSEFEKLKENNIEKKKKLTANQ